MARFASYAGRGGGGTATDATARATASAAKSAVDAITAQTGDKVPAGENIMAAGFLWQNPTAAEIAVPATVSATEMTKAGFTKATAAAQVDEVVLSNADLTGKAPDGAKIGRNVSTGKEFEVASGNWQAITRTDGNALHFIAVRADDTATAPTATETRAVAQEGDTANIKGNTGTIRQWRYASSAWSLIRTDTAPTSVSAMTGASATVDGASGSVPKPAKGDQAKFLRGDGTFAALPSVTSVRDTATATDAGLPTEKAVRDAISAASSATLRLADGGTPAAGGVYVQVAGASHVAPTLAAGQRATVINIQTAGGTIETSYLHDGVAQTASVVASSTPNEVVASTTALSGTAPTGARFGYNSSTNTLYTVVGGSWQAVPALSPADVRFAATAPDSGNTTQTIWVDVSAARWPVYRRALASDAWPTEPTGHVFEVAVANGTAKDIVDRVDAARAWTPLVLSDALRANDEARFKHYATGTIDFNALHTGANTRAIRMYSFSAAVNLTNPPQEGAALGVVGHGYYIGDLDNGQQFVYFLKDSIGRETEYYRERSGGAWTAWTAVSSDGWQPSSNDMQISSGMHVVVADGHKVHFLASDRTRAIRLIPDSDWGNVGEITPGNSWTFDGSFPESGRQEVVLVPAQVEKIWNVSAVLAGSSKPAFIKRTTNTTDSAPTDVEYPDPINGDVVVVMLGNGSVEFWQHDGTDWATGSTIVADPAIIPTVQAGLGAAVKMDDHARPSNFHLNSATGAVTWAVSGAPDGVWHYVMNVGTVDASVTFSGHAKAYLRDGRANTDLGATLTAKPGEAYLVHVTKNGDNRYVNAARLSAATGAAARTITGSATATGYDDVAVPVSITLAAGKALDTVTATNGALVTNINSLLGTCMVMAKGQNTVLSHTTKNAVAYNGLQRVGDKDFALALLTTTATDYTLDVTLQEGDLLEITENYNNNAANDHVHWARVITGRGYISYQYPSSTNGLKIQFPATLDNKIKLNSEGQTNQRLVKIRVWRDAANGFVVPTGTEVRTACEVTCNAGAVNVNGGPTTTAYAGTSMRASIALPAGQRLDTVTANNGATVAIADLFTGTVELAVPKGTTGAIVLTATFTPIVPRVGRTITNADGGVAVPCGTIEVRLPASGNRSMQMRSVTGTLTCRAATVWADGGNTANIVTSLTTAWTYVNSTWNFTTAGQWQDLMFIDQTNNRTYRVKMTIGASYNTNQFWIEEMIE